MNLEEWKESGLQLIKALRVRGEEESFRRLLSDLYPDKAHFIYELFQNAEDAKAESCRFTLTESSLKFEHNGTRLFSEKDVKSITSFGNSTKRDDPTSIGKFGVGFKAVFAYTNTPEVHSGDFHFRIHDLVVPETNGVNKPVLCDRETRFLFPFDHSKKLPAEAADEIKRGLRALGDNTLLFLDHIHSIEYQLSDNSTGSLKRIDHDAGHIEIQACHPGGSAIITHWLRFQKNVEVIDEDGESKPCRIAIAFSLVSDEGKIDQPAWKIVPLKRGQVSIYFPAEKETSNLRFHIHAPFASTVARDSVRNSRANDQLLKHIAELVAESMASIRDQGMLTVDFLAVLPNSSEQLPKFYQPICDHIIQAFKNTALTPTRSGGHARSTSLYRGPVKIADVINDDDLSLLTGCASPLWTANPRQQNQREDQFLKSLSIKDWSWAELCGAINELDGDARDKVENWIRTKEDAWLMRFYALLGEASDSHNEYINVSELSIVRVAAPQGHEHVIPKQAYFPQDERLAAPEFHFVKTSVYQSGAAGPQKRFSESFLKQIGVTTFNERAVIERKLERYNQPAEQIKPSYSSNIKDFIAYWKKTPSDVALFKGYPFLLGYSEDQSVKWCKPSQLCLDAPYIETGLAELTNIHKKFVLSAEYRDRLSETQCKDFIDFLKALGVMSALVVVKVGIESHPDYYKFKCDFGSANDTHTGTNTDYTIINLEEYLKKKSIPASRLVWHALNGAASDVSKARYSPMRKHTPRTYDSHLVHLLKTSKWIPDKLDVFCEPQDIEMHELRKDFPYDDKNGLLTAIGFGGCAKERKEENRAKDESAKAAGFSSAREMDDLKKIRDFGIPLAEIIAQLEQRQQVSQPENSVQNPDRRQEKVLAHAANAPSKESEYRERSVQIGTSEVTAQAKATLRAWCTNSDGQLGCQCCHQEMPFKLKNGEYYFEVVQCIADKEMRHFENRLALCPNCAAMYQYARETNDTEIRRSIVDHEAPDTAASVEIPVRLAGKQYQLRFVGKHWFDLKTVLSQLTAV